MFIRWRGVVQERSAAGVPPGRISVFVRPSSSRRSVPDSVCTTVQTPSRQGWQRVAGGRSRQARPSGSDLRNRYAEALHPGRVPLRREEVWHPVRGASLFHIRTGGQLPPGREPTSGYLLSPLRGVLRKFGPVQLVQTSQKLRCARAVGQWVGRLSILVCLSIRPLQRKALGNPTGES
jgi:hypothetical protein